MKAEDVPIGDRILPDEICGKCGAFLDVLEEAGDEQDTIYIGCPAGDEEDGHTHYAGQPRQVLEAWGWFRDTTTPPGPEV
ncbi:MAG: hypothetical protein WC489_09370 [Patescibacteria group bacterium]|jgi:hypothetical protein